MRVRGLVVLGTVVLLTGCSLDIRERSTEAFDQLEAEVRATSTAYHDRFDRISVDWICDRMNYAKVIEIAGGVQEAADLYNRVCAGRTVE